MSYYHVAFGAVVVLVLGWLYKSWYSVKIYRFMRPDCHWCLKSAVDWHLFRREMRYRFVTPIEINLEDPKHTSLAEKYNVTGVPTIIKVYPNGQFKLYDGDRSLNDLVRFVDEK